MNRPGLLNSKAWEILKKEEKLAITLMLSYDKSTWEAGEIMKKSHYKFLEIKNRGEYFLKLFTEYFVKYGELFPTELKDLSPLFKMYITTAIYSRKSPVDCVNEVRKLGLSLDESYKRLSEFYIVNSRRDEELIKGLDYIKKTKTEHSQALFNLIKEFDRWNNFRILPQKLQEPSAFKRRNKARNLKHLQNLINLPEISIAKLKQRYTYSGKYDKLFLPLFSIKSVEPLQMVVIKKDSANINYLTEIGLFIFNEEKEANDFGKLIINYLTTRKRSCLEGQTFWPKFRDFREKAINYKEIEHISKGRENIIRSINVL